MVVRKIRVFRSFWSKDEKDTDYNFIQWLATEETVIAIVEDIETGQIYQFKLKQYTMAFVKEEEGYSIVGGECFGIWKIRGTDRYDYGHIQNIKFPEDIIFKGDLSEVTDQFRQKCNQDGTLKQ